MSAPSKPVATPLFHEGSEFWQELRSELKRQMEQMNQAVSRHGLEDDELIHWFPGAKVEIVRPRHPSTGIEADIFFRSWGPVISGQVTGHQEDDHRFFPEEFEVSIAKDLDGAAVAVFDEGRSFTPKELAAYLMQHFRRCFPDISLPCEDWRAGAAIELAPEAAGAA
ncbi:MAG: hypothetical protein JO340_02500 [Acidobacteriaceae bacterium]|nr:hypothetical protein [Acidobacteriaceae bacterium]